MSTLRILHNTGCNLVRQAIPVFAALVAIPLLIQGLGESCFGILALGCLVTGYFALFDLGVGRLAFRQMVAHGGQPSKRRADVFRTSLALHALLGLLGGVLLGILPLWLASTALAIPLALAIEGEYAVLWLAAPALVLSSAFRAALEADQRFDLLIAVIVGTRWLVLLAFVPTALSYLVYFNLLGDTVSSAFDQFLLRIIGVYSETMAVALPFVKAHGYLGGTTMPNAKGLFPHERINLETAMHGFSLPGPITLAKWAC